ncbi:MAG: VWA containing CoxE family protein, partial [Mesorhizobium sp.]
FTGRRCPAGADEGRRKRRQRWALPLICLPASARKRGEGRSPLAHLQTIGRQP